MSKPLRLLLVEDSENDALLLLRALSRGGFEPTLERVYTAETMAAALTAHAWDVVISDYAMPNFSGLAALWLLKNTGLDIPFILVSGTIGEDIAVEAMRAGAHDYVMKSNLQRLSTAIEREMREAQVRRERQQAEQTLRFLAQYDALTNLPNRNLLYERLDQALLSGYEQDVPLALLLMDLDRFKEINNTMGHQTGDLLLQDIGARLSSALRESDVVARLGGDEFAVLLPAMDEQGAISTARMLQQAIERPFTVGALTLDARASIGIALFPQHGGDSSTLMRRADIAMYLAKASGSGYEIYSPERDSYSPERLLVMADLHRAIDNDQLFLMYQPKINLRTGLVVGVEALARWQHPKIGLVPPDQFIPMAERTGFIRPLTMWSLNAALGQARAWHEQRFELTVGVNLSACILHDYNFPRRIEEMLTNHGVAPRQLELEITEGVIMTDPARALDILTRVSQMGITLSIDDFGTGYSSLAYLKKLPVNAVKIDKSFVLQMTKDENDARIVCSTIDLAHNLGLKVIAEGVESREVWDRLLALGCDDAQGYYMSRPLPAEEMTNWLAESPWALKGYGLRSAPSEIVDQTNER